MDPRPPARVSRRAIALGAIVLALGAMPSAYMWVSARAFPPDTTPEGAYLRVVLAISENRVASAFAYLETEAQWSLFSLHDYERRAYDLVEQSYPEPERARLLAQYRAAHESRDAEQLFARLAESRGWTARLRKDLSGVGQVEIQGERATVQTARGTRYPFRKRDNGIWGLTLFTAELRSDAQRAARDFAVVERAAADYRAAK